MARVRRIRWQWTRSGMDGHVPRRALAAAVLRISSIRSTESGWVAPFLVEWNNGLSPSRMDGPGWNSSR